MPDSVDVSQKSVLIAGNCGPDFYALERLVRGLGISAIVVADSIEDVQQIVKRQFLSLLLINRVFDLTGESGLDLIAGLPDDIRGRCMLISNFADAQKSAVEFGALLGFGKNKLARQETREMIRSAISD